MDCNGTCSTAKDLLLDEPTTYLDIAHQIEVMQIVDELNKREK